MSIRRSPEFLTDASGGFVVDFSSDGALVTDDPHGETKQGWREEQAERSQG